MTQSLKWSSAAGLVCLFLAVQHADATVLFSDPGPYNTDNTNNTGPTTLDTSQMFNSGVVYLGFDMLRTTAASAANTFAGVQMSTNSGGQVGGDLAFGNRWPSTYWGWFDEGGSNGDYIPLTAVDTSTHRVVGKLDFTGVASMFLDPTDAIEGNNTSTATVAPNSFRYLHLRSGHAGNTYTWSNIVISDNFAEAAGISAPIPEPMTMLAVGLTVAGLGGYVRKRRRG